MSPAVNSEHQVFSFLGQQLGVWRGEGGEVLHLDLARGVDENFPGKEIEWGKGWGRDTAFIEYLLCARHCSGTYPMSPSVLGTTLGGGHQHHYADEPQRREELDQGLS
jgi:hypothetical protein